MNIELAQRAIAAVNELVWFTGANDEDIAGAGLSFLIAERPL